VLNRLFRFITLSFTAPAGLIFGQSISFLAPVNSLIPGATQAAGACSSCLATADFNGDGKADVAYMLSNAAGVLLGNGDGTFRPGPAFPVSQPVGTVWAADFNGDGKTDVAISGSATSIFLSNGDGTFQSGVSVSACSAIAAVADFNGDHKADLVCGATVLLSNGDATFRTGLPVDGNPLLSADFNRDGRPDLLLKQVPGALAVAISNGDGTFGPDIPATTLPASLFRDAPPTSVVTGDFNGDGKPDLAVGVTKAGLFLIALGNGDGTFGPPIVNSNNGAAPGTPVLEAPVLAADFNSDGKLDLLAEGAIWPGKGDGTFGFPAFVSGGSVAADFNGDGLPDLAGVTQNVLTIGVATFLNDSPGDGFITAGVSSASLTWPVAPGSILSAFGTNLAPQTAVGTISNGAFPTTLGGIRLHVGLPGADTLAQLLYVSPNQINYVLPLPLSPISIERVGSPYVAKSIRVEFQYDLVSLYSMSGGLAAANAVRVADGIQTAVPVLSCSGTNCSAVPIDVSGAPVFLSLYGTGFDAVFPGMVCSAAGQKLQVTYEGAQMQIPGLDQINVVLPPSLAGAGMVSITCSAQYYPANMPPIIPATGPPSNAVQVMIH
jgi:uncharacterized protein (TIGR03437 family)